MQALETIDRAGMRLEIFPDDSAFNPRGDWTRNGDTYVGIIAGFQSRNRLRFGDCSFDTPADFLSTLADEVDPDFSQKDEGLRRLLEAAGMEEGDEAFDRAVDALTWQAIDTHCLLIPLRLFESSGQLSVSETAWNPARVDACMYVSHARIRDEWGEAEDALDRAGAALRGELENYVQWLNGDCVGFRLTRLDEDGEEAEEIDSCWGFIGSDWRENGITDCLPAAFLAPEKGAAHA